jgi:predicted nucleic acid-binding protein
MILVDTSVWVDHFRKGNRELTELLSSGGVLCHPFVIGELACGTLRNREEVLRLLGALPQTPLAEDGEVLAMIARRRLWGLGLGWVDMHLLASVQLAGCDLWTLDKSLAKMVLG